VPAGNLTGLQAYAMLMKMEKKMEIEQRIQEFLITNFFLDDAFVINRDESLIYQGVLDSTGAIELISFIEREFNLTIHNDEIIPENFDSIQSIISFITSRHHQTRDQIDKNKDG